MKVGRNITFGSRTPAVIHKFYQNIFVDSYCFLLKNMAELTEMDRSLSRIKKITVKYEKTVDDSAFCSCTNIFFSTLFSLFCFQQVCFNCRENASS